MAFVAKVRRFTDSHKSLSLLTESRRRIKEPKWQKEGERFMGSGWGLDMAEQQAGSRGKEVEDKCNGSNVAGSVSVEREGERGRFTEC